MLELSYLFQTMHGDSCNNLVQLQRHSIIRKSVQILGVILFIIFINELPRASDKALTVLFAEVILTLESSGTI